MPHMNTIISAQGPHRRLPVLMALALFLLGPQVMRAQKGGADSAAFYERIHAYSQKHKVTRWIYDGIFAQPSSGDVVAPSDPASRRVDPYLKYKGRIIRRITVQVRDPFGYSVEDTGRAPINRVERIGNGLHRTTRRRVVQDLLLVNVFDRIDPLKIAESERLLRVSPVVNDARIVLRPVKSARDSVDVLVYVLDKWSIDVVADAGTSGGSLTLSDRNILGLGHQLEQGASYTLGSDRPGLSGRYAVYNFDRSYIGSTVFYSTSDAQDQVGAEVHRAFFSPLTKWAGGAALNKQWIHPLIADVTGALIRQPQIAPVALDVWLGRSYRLSDDTSRYGQSSSIVLGARYAQTRFVQRPSFDLDTAHLNSNVSLYLVGAGLSLQQFYKERYLFRFGLTEDVPEGLLFRVNAGIRKRELNGSEPYLGAEITRGRNFDTFGYLTATLAYGTFFQRGHGTDGALRLDIDYFTDLLTLGKWHLRQFVKWRSTIGLNKQSGQLLTLNGEQLYGFNSSEVSGTRKNVLTLQTLLYAPFSILGFRFAPIALIGVGTVDDQHDPWFAHRIYPAFGLGLLVRNEYLLVKTFQFSIGFYPDVPGVANATTVFDPINSFQLGARSYAFSEPDVVGYY